MSSSTFGAKSLQRSRLVNPSKICSKMFLKLVCDDLPSKSSYSSKRFWKIYDTFSPFCLCVFQCKYWRMCSTNMYAFFGTFSNILKTFCNVKKFFFLFLVSGSMWWSSLLSKSPIMLCRYNNSQAIFWTWSMLWTCGICFRELCYYFASLNIFLSSSHMTQEEISAVME